MSDSSSRFFIAFVAPFVGSIAAQSSDDDWVIVDMLTIQLVIIKWGAEESGNFSQPTHYKKRGSRRRVDLEKKECSLKASLASCYHLNYPKLAINESPLVSIGAPSLVGRSSSAIISVVKTIKLHNRARTPHSIRCLSERLGSRCKKENDDIQR